MKKVLILTRFRGEYEPKRLAEEAEKLGYVADKVNYEHIRVGVSILGKPIVDLGNGKKVEDYDLIVPRAASKRGAESMLGVKTILLEYVEQAKNQKIENLPVGKASSKTQKEENKEITVINGESFKFFPLMGKLEQGVLLAQAGLPVIPFVSFNGVRGWRRYLEILAKKKGGFTPVMVKARFGSHGKNVKLADTLVKLHKLAQKYSEGDVLIQPVLKVRRWYRVLVLHGKILGMMKHRQKDKFQVVSQQEELSKIIPRFTPEQMVELEKVSLAAVKVLKADFAGLDVAWDEDAKQWRIFEVNRTAQFKWFEKAFPEINVAREMVGKFLEVI